MPGRLGPRRRGRAVGRTRRNHVIPPPHRRPVVPSPRPRCRNGSATMITGCPGLLDIFSKVDDGDASSRPTSRSYTTLLAYVHLTCFKCSTASTGGMSPSGCAATKRPVANESGQLVHACRHHGRRASYPDALRPRADVVDDAPGLLGELVEVLLHPVEIGNLLLGGAAVTMSRPGWFRVRGRQPRTSGTGVEVCRTRLTSATSTAGAPCTW